MHDARCPPLPAHLARDMHGAASVLPIECRDIVVRRGGRHLLDGVDLRLESRGVSVVMGPNGAGKSLLLRVLAALVTPDAGSVTWGGATPRRSLRPRLGVVFQKPVLLRRSALANVRYALRAAGTGRAASRERARDALEVAGLGDLAGAPARLLSGGEQQRLATARALATGPEVLFLDEPTANLDPASTAAIESIVKRVAASGRKVVLVTHDVAQARRLADRVVFLHRGRIAERAGATEFFESPVSDAARAFLAGDILL